MLQTPPLSLYIHIPWCVRKCPYCDFNSHAQRGALPESAYVRALLTDLAQDLPWVEGRTVQSVFFGGGTPSLFAPESIARILEGVRARIDLAVEAEITLEANPGTAEAGRFAGFRQAGINRLSLGVQSFDAARLRALGRIHGGDEALAAIDMARQAGFGRINLDLMYGLPGQTPEGGLNDLHTALAADPGHLSWYQLGIEPHTAFHESPPELPPEDCIAELQQAGQELLLAHGYRQYEVSAYAAAGQACRHNRNYWEYGDYLGIGAGAHGKLTDAAAGRIRRMRKPSHPARYLAAAGAAELSEVSLAERPLEFLMNALRLVEGFAEHRFEERTGLPLGVIEPLLADAVGEGLLEWCDGRVRASPRGHMFLNRLLERFVDLPLAEPRQAAGMGT